MPNAALREAMPCKRRNTTNGLPCGRTTTNPWGDCGRHDRGSSGHAAVINRDATSRLGEADLVGGAAVDEADDSHPRPFVPTRIERELLTEHGRELVDLAMSDNTRSEHYEKEEYSVAVPASGGAAYQRRYRYVQRVRDEKWEIPNDPEVTPEILTHLLTSPHEDVVRSVAQGEHTDDASREFCSTHESSSVRWDVARHPKSTDSALSNLKDDPDRRVRAALVRRERLPDDVVDHMKNDPSVDVKWELLGREHLPEGVLEHMSADGTRRIRRRAQKRLKKERH